MEGGKEEYARTLRKLKMFVKGYQRQLSFFKRHHIQDRMHSILQKSKILKPIFRGNSVLVKISGGFPAGNLTQ